MLARRIDLFLRKTRMPQTKFGRLAINDPRFVRDIRNGRVPGARIEQRVELFMNTYKEPRRAH